MKRVELTIKEDGNYTINAMEGFVVNLVIKKQLTL